MGGGRYRYAGPPRGPELDDPADLRFDEPDAEAEHSSAPAAAAVGVASVLVGTYVVAAVLFALGLLLAVPAVLLLPDLRPEFDQTNDETFAGDLDASVQVVSGTLGILARVTLVTVMVAAAVGLVVALTVAVSRRVRATRQP